MEEIIWDEVSSKSWIQTLVREVCLESRDRETLGQSW
jgi:hypothetical protein